MSTRLFVVLFASIFLVGIVPMLFAASFGLPGAGITSGFLMPVQNFLYAIMFIAVGLISAWLRKEAILLLPFSILIMLIVGGLMEIDAQTYPAAHAFILGGIILFSLGLSIMRRKALLAYIMPLSVLAYYCGGNFMGAIPSITTPLFFLVGAVVSSLLMIAIGVATGMTLFDRLDEWVGPPKMRGAFASFLSFF